MKKLAILLSLCLALCPMGLAEAEAPSAADEFLSNLSKTWDSFLDMTAEAGKDAAQWAQDSGVAQWAQDTAEGVSKWAQETAKGVMNWAGETAQGVQEYMDEKGPEINSWIQRNGAKAARNVRYFTDSIQGINTYFPETENFVGTWHVDDYILEMTHDSDDPAVLSCVITKYIDDHSATRWVYDECVYDDVGKGLSTFDIGVMTNLVLGDDHEVVSSQQIWSGGAAAFCINDAGQLIWMNFKSDPGEEDMVFEKVVENAGEDLVSVKNDVPKTIAPIEQKIDVNRLYDGSYAVAFTPDDVVSGEDGLTLKNVHIFTQDRYDAAEIDAAEVGDTIVVEGEAVPVLTLEKGDDITVNAEQDARAFYLVKSEDGDEYTVTGLNDLTTYTEHGVVDLVIDPSATLTDSWDIDADILKVSYDGIAEAITTSENASFTQDNTVIWVEGGRIVEIIRSYMP